VGENGYFPADVVTDPQRVGRMDDALVLYLLLWRHVTDRDAETGEIDFATAAEQLRRSHREIWSLAQRLEELGEVRFSPVLRMPDEQDVRHAFRIERPAGNDTRRPLGTFLREEDGKYTA